MVVLIQCEANFSPQIPPVIPPQTAHRLGIIVLELLIHLCKRKSPDPLASLCIVA